MFGIDIKYLFISKNPEEGIDSIIVSTRYIVIRRAAVLCVTISSFVGRCFTVFKYMILKDQD